MSAEIISLEAFAARRQLDRAKDGLRNTREELERQIHSYLAEKEQEAEGRRLKWQSQDQYPTRLRRAYFFEATRQCEEVKTPFNDMVWLQVDRREPGVIMRMVLADKSEYRLDQDRATRHVITPGTFGRWLLVKFWAISPATGEPVTDWALMYSRE